MKKRKRCRISVVETDDTDEINQPPSAPRRLVTQLLDRRRSLSLPSHSAPLAQSESLDVWTLCDDYGEQDYESMDDDVHRNAAYTRAFAAVSPRRDRWLEIGCGASATLTRLALASAPSGTTIAAFEVNPQSAAAATAQLRRAGLAARATVVVGKSTQPELLADPAEKFAAVLHEVFGIFASSEGAPQMLGHARQQYLSGKHQKKGLIPSRCATFFTPCDLRPDSLDGCESLLCNSEGPQPKLLLAPAAPLDGIALCASSRAFEIYDCGAAMPLDTVQTKAHEFVVAKDGELNCLGCFIWVDLGLGEPAPPSEDNDKEDEDESGFKSCFPFGDGSLPGGSGSKRRLNDFTSLCTEQTLRNSTYASNWQNPLLLLPTAACVRRGDRVCVTTVAAADTLTPSYRFDVIHHPGRHTSTPTAA